MTFAVDYALNNYLSQQRLHNPIEQENNRIWFLQQQNKLDKAYKRFQSQGHVNQILTEHAHTQRAKGG